MNTNEFEFEGNLEVARLLLDQSEPGGLVDDLLDANEFANEALRIRPADPQAWLVKAQIMSAIGDEFAALASVDVALSADPGSAEALYWRAAILVDLDRHDEALTAIDGALARLTRDDEWLIEHLYYERAVIQDALNQTDEALQTMHQGLARCPESPILQAGLAPIQRERVRASLKLIPGGLS